MSATSSAERARRAQELPRSMSIAGVGLAMLILAAWAGCLLLFLSVDVAALHPLAAAAAVVLQTFLYTGLFITAHDAMHRTVAPHAPRLNDAIGHVAVRLYALFSYAKLRDKHREHHAHPASAHDPDFHDGEHSGFGRWYINFVRNYVAWPQIVGMAIVYNALHHLAGVPLANLNLFWVLPALLSTLQLFYFGTYLPHRQPDGDYPDEHRARSNDFTIIWSFLSCYHFGYHWEHHEAPYVPWWRLPAYRRRMAPPADAPDAPDGRPAS